MTRLLPFVALALAAACTPKKDAEVAALQARTTSLEAQVAALEAKVQVFEARLDNVAPLPPDPTKEQEAQELYGEARTAMEAMDMAKAKELTERLVAEYPGTRAAAAAQRMEAELAIVGKPVTAIEVDRWIQGSATPNDHRATLVVYFETWCPHCKREVPKLQELYTRMQAQGLGVVGLTKLTRSSTEEELRTFIAENGITYPIGVETGSMSEEYGVRGIPAAMIIRDGQVVWRGHPGYLTDEALAGLL